MSLLIVAGSHRRRSQSLRVARFVERSWAELLAIPATLIDLAEMRESWWYDDGTAPTGDQAALRLAAQACTGLVCVTPEWNGMATPIVKNFFLLMSGFELANKPGYIVSVSGGAGGAYPVQELRSSGYKNAKICWIPEHLIVRGAGELDLEAADDFETGRIAARLENGLATLALYMRALAPHAEAVQALARVFPYGM